MQSENTLEVSVVESISILTDSVNERRYWCSFNYDYTLKKIDELEKVIRNLYFKKAAQTLKETSRQIFENTFGGDIQLFINYFNGILYLKKLQQRVLWHQKYGKFEDE